jgi:hypothetical protein
MSTPGTVLSAYWTRHASVRVVTSAFDRIDSRGAFLDLAGRAGVPILAVYGDETPRKSLAEIEKPKPDPNAELHRTLNTASRKWGAREIRLRYLPKP